ncbi:hypothetical protein XF14_04190 [Burkholderia gladioli]|nr:hypothetical protein XF14_04190 [Burkholderia gladioli]
MQRGSRLKADKGTTETVGERDFLSPADIASSWGHHHQFILTIRKKVQVRMHGFQRDDSQVRAPRSNGRHDIVAEPFLQRDPHIRECLEKPRKVVGKMRADRVVVREQGHVADQPVRKWQQVGIHLFHLGNTTPGVLHYDAARGGGYHAAREPLEQGNSDYFLQALDPQADR